MTISIDALRKKNHQHPYAPRDVDRGLGGFDSNINYRFIDDPLSARFDTIGINHREAYIGPHDKEKNRTPYDAQDHEDEIIDPEKSLHVQY